MEQVGQRIIVDPSSRGVYGLLGALVSPRPIAWVSTVSSDGVDNIAPHSFYQLVSTEPPIVMISSMGEKDTSTNIRETGEFVVCGTPASLIREINLTAVEFDHGVSEFDEAGITREPSARVRPMRVMESPYALECKLTEIHPMGNGTVIFGKVVCIAIDAVVMDGHRVNVRELDLIARLAGMQWSTLGEIVELPRNNIDQHSAGEVPELNVVAHGKSHTWAELS